MVLDSISLVNTPPRVSIPSESGVTSNNNTSVTSPANTPPCIAAPIETTSSGFTDLFGSLPKKFLTIIAVNKGAEGKYEDKGWERTSKFKENNDIQIFVL